MGLNGGVNAKDYGVSGKGYTDEGVEVGVCGDIGGY